MISVAATETIHMHVIQNFAAPRQHYLNMFPGTEDFLWDDPWFRRRCGGNEHFVVDVWQIEMANWKRELANQIKVLADDTSPAILLRPTEHSPLCAGLGEELALLDISRGRGEETLCGRHDLRDFFGTRTTRVFAWAQVSVTSLSPGEDRLTLVCRGRPSPACFMSA